MHAASREALAHITRYALSRVENDGAVAATVGTELFDVVTVLDGSRLLRTTIAEQTNPKDLRVGVVRRVYGGKISSETLDIVAEAVSAEWSNNRELRNGLVRVGRRALLAAAALQGQAVTVEEELFRVQRTMESSPELLLQLSDSTHTPQQRRGLFASVLYGKISSLAEALSLQVVERVEKNLIEDLKALVDQAAAARGRCVAFVLAALPLSEHHEAALSAELARIYGTEMSLHVDVDTRLLGGAIVRVGDEIIDGSVSGKLDKLKAQFA